MRCCSHAKVLKNGRNAASTHERSGLGVSNQEFKGRVLQPDDEDNTETLEAKAAVRVNGVNPILDELRGGAKDVALS